MFWSEVDGALLRESVKMADPVRESIKAQVDIDEIIDQWRLSYPVDSEVTSQEARAWAKTHIRVNNRELEKGLGILYAIGWLFGRDVATSAYAHARLNKAAPTDEALKNLLNIDWANWTPGNNPGALLAAPPGGLKGLLQRRGLDLQGLTNTLLNRIGTQLADALTSGTSDTMLGKALEKVVGDPERALTIANTSMASAMSVSTRETYQEFGVAKMRWLALEPCSTCSGNGAIGPIAPGEALFKNVEGDNITEPPAHPNCRCALAPVIDLDQFKFSQDQPRDDRGRFAATGYPTWEDISTSEQQALTEYQSSGYQTINGHLRGRNLPYAVPSDIDETVANLDSLIDSMPPLEKNATLYRGVQGKLAEDLLLLKTGDSFTDKAYTSASKSGNVARSFTSDSGDGSGMGADSAVIVIKASKGTKAFDVDKFFDEEYEAEVILPRNSKFVVESVREQTVFVKVSNE